MAQPIAGAQRGAVPAGGSGVQQPPKPATGSPGGQPVVPGRSVSTGNRPSVVATSQVPAVPKAPAGPPFQMHGLTEYDRWLKMIAYGDYGSGKTRLLGSAVLVPDMRDVFLIDAEAGDLTIATEELFKDLK